MSVLNSVFVKKSRLCLISKRITLVRKMRGSMAPGDNLLQAALQSVKSNDVSSAKSDITKFLQVVPNVKVEERAILDNSVALVQERSIFRFFPTIVNILSWFFSFWLKLKSKSPLSYNFSGNILPVYIK